MKLFLKGGKCFTDKCPIEKRNFAPGQHGKDRKAKIVGYGLQLREKQKAKRMYFAQEGQFRNYFERAARAKGVTGEMLLQQLERRLDNVVYRLGFAVARRQARQLVRHGHVAVNGRKVKFLRSRCSVGDEIAVRESSNKLAMLEVGEGIRQPSGCRRHGWKSIATATRAGCWRCRSAKTSTCPSTSS